MAFRAYFITFMPRDSRVHENPRNAFQIVQGSYKLSYLERRPRRPVSSPAIVDFEFIRVCPTGVDPNQDDRITPRQNASSGDARTPSTCEGHDSRGVIQCR